MPAIALKDIINEGCGSGLELYSIHTSPSPYPSLTNARTMTRIALGVRQLEDVHRIRIYCTPFTHPPPLSLTLTLTLTTTSGVRFAVLSKGRDSSVAPWMSKAETAHRVSTVSHMLHPLHLDLGLRRSIRTGRDTSVAPLKSQYASQALVIVSHKHLCVYFLISSSTVLYAHHQDVKHSPGTCAVTPARPQAPSATCKRKRRGIAVASGTLCFFEASINPQRPLRSTHESQAPSTSWTSEGRWGLKQGVRYWVLRRRAGIRSDYVGSRPSTPARALIGSRVLPTVAIDEPAHYVYRPSTNGILSSEEGCWIGRLEESLYILLTDPLRCQATRVLPTVAIDEPAYYTYLPATNRILSPETGYLDCEMEGILLCIVGEYPHTFADKMRELTFVLPLFLQADPRPRQPTRVLPTLAVDEPAHYAYPVGVRVVIHDVEESR
ncbi:hypothetical protein CVT25_000132 [Psilocybe cyanescens]|uniref:Uncharacterized protein n=1 Tax=Psilocybe cyanescens TaxID=93625 RepID=A0A409XQE4_PSICY|nr:hypothetical protein CVT25_000132 [Psilocybe cyanescens]